MAKLKEIAFAECRIDFFDCKTEGIRGEDISEMFSSPVILVKKTKSGEKEVDISSLVESVSAEIRGDGMCVTAITSAKSESYLNPEYVAKAIENRFAVQGERGYHLITRERLLREDKSLFR